MSRKVVLLGPLPPPYGGVSVYLSHLWAHLWPRGARMWAYFGGPYEGAPGVSRFSHRRLGLLTLALREGRGARVLDATHFHFEHPNALLLPAWLACKLVLGLGWYKNVHDGTLPSRHRDFGPLRRLLFRLAARHVTEYVVVSEELRRWLSDEIGVRQRVTVIPALVPLPARAPDAPPPAEIEAALGDYSRRARRVCSAGVFTPDYGFADAARAVETLRRETGEDVGLLLLDGTFARDDGYRRDVLAGRDWITVLENVPNQHVYALLRRSHCFVRAFSGESYGISRVEATWCGLPVVATTAGETRGMLTYEFGDVAALTRQLRRALSEPPRAEIEEWSQQFRREAEENLRALEEILGLTSHARR